MQNKHNKTIQENKLREKKDNMQNKHNKTRQTE